jgi:hypothetical protein
VATLYSNLVTRPTGEAVRVAIERQVEDTEGPCLSILDFSRVGVIDFSCADEVIAKLLIKYQAPDRPSDIFFVVQGASEHHRDLIETVLERHNLALVAIDAEGPELWGVAPSRLREAWEHLDRFGQTAADQLASARGVSEPVASSWLRRLAARRLAIAEGPEKYSSLGAALRSGPRYDTGNIDGLLAAEGNPDGYGPGVGLGG